MTTVMPAVREILVLGHNHFDPMWRRCFLADAVYNGTTVKPYADIEALVLDGWLALAPRGYSFTEGQAVVLREWLRRRPDARAGLRAAIAQGSFGPVQAGETVQDSNLSTAEGLVRNFLVAAPLWRELGIEDHPGMQIAWLEDAFGNSANYPQVLLGVGCTVAAKLSYRACPGDVWTGIDGSSIALLDRVPMHYHGAPTKYPPCPECSGAGCAACSATGLQLVPVLAQESFTAFLASVVAAVQDPAAKGPAAGAFQGWDAAVDAGLSGGTPGVGVGGEETLPVAGILHAVEAVAASCPPGITVRFGTWVELYERYRPRLAAAVARADGSPSPELNPAMPGCMVTRRETKTRSRASAYRLCEAESRIASDAWRSGAPVSAPAEFGEAWRAVAFAQFHDAITGTHIDAAFREMMQFLDRADAVAARHGAMAPSRPENAGPWRAAGAGEQRLLLGRLTVRFDRMGILGVACGGRELLTAVASGPTMHALRVGELLLESDFGDAWGQRIAPLGDFSSRGLGEFHDQVEIAPNAIRWRGRYRGGHRKVRHLTWTVEVAASSDGDRLDYRCDIDWDAESKRIRAVVGVPSTDPTWLGEIPFGHIRRTFDAAKTDWSQWTGHQNEYPILHWAQHRLPDGAGVALLTEGLPCVRWQPGRFDLSLLRSPEWEFCQVEPMHYDFWDTDGQRDAGRHVLSWSIWPAPQAQSSDALTRAGYAYNRPGFTAPPCTIEGTAIVTAWKPSEDGQGWILRLQETSGTDSTISVAFDRPCRIEPCDLLERVGRAGSTGPSTSDGRWSARVQRHGICTLRIL